MNRDYLLSNKLYDVLKFVAVVLLPALGTLYFTLSGIWGLPAAEQVLGTGAAIATFLGVVLKLGDRSYNNSDAKFDGTMDVVEDEKKSTYMLNLHKDPDDLAQADVLAFKVNKTN